MALGQDREVWGELKVSAAEQAEYEPELFAKRITEIPSNMQMRAAYSATDGLPDYVGYAPRGLTAATTGWLLQKFTYDASRQCTLRQIAYSSWDLRADAGTVYA